MTEKLSLQRQIAEAAFAKVQQRPANHVIQELSFSNSERLIKSARLRELRMAQDRYKK